MFEGGHRWIDLRRLNRLTDEDRAAAGLPSLRDILTGPNAHNIDVMFPIPLAEQLARPQ
jgi:hypothetical protein